MMGVKLCLALDAQIIYKVTLEEIVFHKQTWQENIGEGSSYFP